MKAFIRSASCISPQQTFNNGSFSNDEPAVYNSDLLDVIEPSYKDIIDAKLMRRMSKIVRIGAATALNCLQKAGVSNVDAIVTGTAYGCMEDSENFLKNIVLQDEQMLSPTAFIQSTHNTVAAQIALLLKCHNYNNTYVHRGFSFEHALTDAMLLLQDDATQKILAGSADELTPLTFSVLKRLGIYKQYAVNTEDLYTSTTRGSIAGQGAAFFLLSGKSSADDLAVIDALQTFYAPGSIAEVEQGIETFLSTQKITAGDIDLFITGRNGDAGNDKLYDGLQSSVLKNIPAVNYKHLCGEYPTATSFAVWLAANILKQQKLPQFFKEVATPGNGIKRILVYNNYQHKYHSLILLSAAGLQA